MKPRPTNINRPRQAAPDDPRWEQWIERAREDLEFLGSVLMVEGNPIALEILEHQKQIVVLADERSKSLEISTPVQRNVRTRICNGQILEHWRNGRASARVGGKIRFKFGVETPTRR